MSEKRFEYDKCTGIKDLSIDENDDQFLYPTQIVDLLNEQQNMIKNLTSQFEILCDDFKRVVSENSVLRKENKRLQKENTTLLYIAEDLGVKIVEIDNE